FENGDGQRVLYHVTQTSATPITIAEEDADWMADSYRLEIIANSATRVVLVAGGSTPTAAALLINLTDHTAHLLAEEVPFLPISGAGFSEDGVYLRYLGRNGGEDEPWTLRERKLGTGEERVF